MLLHRPLAAQPVIRIPSLRDIENDISAAEVQTLIEAEPVEHCDGCGARIRVGLLNTVTLYDRNFHDPVDSVQYCPSCQ
ncbi:hypothetical protein [Deinococcus kurensis]|uniref:hypothetical protein n=1 Tax=Deinococcus kurensis TaxID=2662757 RepID=UPI0012D31D74|nr:hypothetical protein [Deinococcus kurensis]